MQGGLQYENKSIFNLLKNSYETRKEPAELFKSFSIPKELDSAYKRASSNVPKFSFYYFCVAAVFSFFFFISNWLASIPIAIAFGCYFLSRQNFKVSDYEITPVICIYGCIIVNVILALVFNKIAHCYFSFIVFSSICTLIVLGHAALMEETEESTVNDV